MNNFKKYEDCEILYSICNVLMRNIHSLQQKEKEIFLFLFFENKEKLTCIIIIKKVL